MSSLSSSSSSSRRPTTTNQHDKNEEDAVLATLQASLQDQSEYEKQVIREATHSLAPALPASLGLPCLTSLTTTTTTTTTTATTTTSIPVVQDILERVRRQQEQLVASNNDNDDNDNDNDSTKDIDTRTAATDLACFKEQLLLHYLETVCGVTQDDDDGRGGGTVPSIQNVRRQQGRQKQILQRQQQQGEARRTTTQQQQQQLSNDSIGLSRSVTDADDNNPNKRKRQRRQIQHITDNADDPVYLSATERQALAQRRKERHARKAARRRQRLQVNDTVDDESEMELEQEVPSRTFNDTKMDSPMQRHSQSSSLYGNDMTETEQDVVPLAAVPAAAAASTSAEEKINNNSNIDTSPTETLLICPLCVTPVETRGVPKNDDDNNNNNNNTAQQQQQQQRDALLAQHMQTCQSSFGRRSSRRCTTTEATVVVEVQETNVAAAAVRTDTGRSSLRASRKQAVTAAAATMAQTRIAPATGTTMAMDDLDEAAYEDRVDDWIEQGLSQMKEMKERIVNVHEVDIGDNGPWQEYGKGFFVPAWIHRRLFGYQRDGLKWMWGLHQQGCGGCLGDEMGLGKTVSVAAYLGSLAANRKIKSALIVVPATMLQHWLKELTVWAPGLRRIIIHASGETDGRSRSVTPRLLKALSKWLQQARKDRVYEAIDEQDEASQPPHSFCGTGYAILTTYENVRRSPEIYVAHPWSYVVLDEAQKIRNPDADVTVTMKRLRTPHRIAMSGTPIQNDLNELWSLFDFCFPSRLGTLPAFQQELADPIKRGGYSNATPMQVQMAYRCALVVRDLIGPYLLRRTKKEVKEVALMPKKTEHVLFCRLSETQRALYESYLRSDHVAKVMRGSANLLGAITMLRKICNHPDLVCDPTSVESLITNDFNVTSTTYNYESESSNEDDDYEGDYSMIQRSGKLEVLSKILPLWKKQGHRVLIFCQWRKMLNLIEHFVNLQGWKFGRLDGNTNVASRQRLVDNFNQDESYFGLLCTTRTGGVGLNLTGANRIILYDPDWNPQTDAQARERAWRFGQEKEVTIYRLITAGTVEEKIYHRQIFKTAMSNRVLQDPRQRRLFSQRDLRDLFTLKADTGSVRAGGDGSTETATYTQGIGVVDPDADIGRENEDDADERKDDNEDTLKTVMQSKGLAGVFDHHFVEQDSSRKSTTVREMEEKAKEVARAAMAALRQSVADEQAPNEPQRFGGGGGGLAAATSSSKSLLTGLRQQQAAATGTAVVVDDETKKYAKLLAMLKEYVRRKRPSTDDILSHFEGSVVSSEPAVFRRLLKSVAVLQNGRWHPK